MKPALAIIILFIGLGFPSHFVAAESPTKPRNVILIVGDGMGPQQLGLSKLFAQYTSHKEFKNSAVSNFLSQSELGLMQSIPHDALVNDSAAAITEIASGMEVLSETLGIDDHGRAVTSLLELARANRKVAGLVSDTRITHATPAGFVGKVTDRNNENEIATQLIKRGPEIMFSGGLRHFLPKSSSFDEAFKASSKRSDDTDLLKLAREKGYQIIFDRSGLKGLKQGKALGLFAESGMQDGIAESQALSESTGQPSLAELSQSAIKLLSGSKQGFFLMIEAGQIDWACHQNDAGTLLHEMLRLERVLKTVQDFVKGRDDTLVILTADHETGGFGFSYSGANIPEPKPFPGLKDGSLYAPQYNFGDTTTLDRLYDQKISFNKLFYQFSERPKEERNAKSLVEFVNANSSFQITLNDADGILETEKNPFYRPNHETLSKQVWPVIFDFSAFYPDFKSRQSALLARALAEQQSVVWASGTHTSTPVIVAAYGRAEWTVKFKGFYTAVELGQRLKAIVGGN